MSLTGWTLVLGGAGVIGFFGRKRWIKKRRQSQQDLIKRKSRADEAELDRIACEDLGQSLISSSPGGQAQSKSGTRSAGGSG